MTKNNIDDLREARYMSRSCPPASPEAMSPMGDIIDMIAKSEKKQRAIKADEVPVFKSAVGLIIGDLLIGSHTKESGWSYLSVSTSAFSDRPVLRDFQNYCGNNGGSRFDRSLFGPKLEKHPV